MSSITHNTLTHVFKREGKKKKQEGGGKRKNTEKQGQRDLVSLHRLAKNA